MTSMCPVKAEMTCSYIIPFISIKGSIDMTHSSSSKPSSTIISQKPITAAGCCLLDEISDDSEHHCSFLQVYNLNELVIDNLDKITEYNLKDVAKEIGISTSDKDKNEVLASNIIKKCLEDLGPTYEYQINVVPKIGNTSVSKLKECYISKNNKGDVLVSYQGSDVLYVEVHSSSTYDCTARKTVFLLMECLRLLKAFGVKQPKMDAFVFPRKEHPRCVVMLSMQYSPDLVQFQYSFRCLKISEIHSVLRSAVKSNTAVCQNLIHMHQPDSELDYILWLTVEEREKWGSKLDNEKSKFGILLMNDSICLKKPISSESFYKLLSITQIQHMPTYSPVVPPLFVKYNKIKYDPLNYEEGRRCSRELVIKVTTVIQSIHTVFADHGHGYMHNDLRLPNICFDENFNPVLIDLDFYTFYIQKHTVDKDMKRFADELVKCFESSQVAQDDLFIQKYKKGNYDKSLLENSIVNTGSHSVKSVITTRTVP